MTAQTTSEKEDIALKLSIEAAMIVSLLSLFRQIARDFQVVYSATGQVLSAQIYKPKTTAILRTGYRRGARMAGKEIREVFDIVSPDAQEIDSRIDANLVEFVGRESEQRSEIITRTTDSQLNNMTLQAILAAALSGLFPRNEDVARDVSNRFTANSRGRSQNIAVTETLNAVEGSRLIEANTLSQEGAKVKPKKKDAPPVSVADKLIRMWMSRKDERVRPTHVVADGQTVRGTTQPFTVGDSLMMYPGDTSLGADLSEIVGCRCFAATFIG